MEIIDISNPVTLLLLLAVLVGVIFLGKSTKNSILSIIMLAVFLGLLIYYVVLLRKPELIDMRTVIVNCMSINFIFLFLSFISYLWIDDIEAKKKHKKSVDNSLDWFWRETD